MTVSLSPPSLSSSYPGWTWLQRKASPPQVSSSPSTPGLPELSPRAWCEAPVPQPRPGASHSQQAAGLAHCSAPPPQPWAQQLSGQRSEVSGGRCCKVWGVRCELTWYDKVGSHSSPRYIWLPPHTPPWRTCECQTWCRSSAPGRTETRGGRWIPAYQHRGCSNPEAGGTGRATVRPPPGQPSSSWCTPARWRGRSGSWCRQCWRLPGSSWLRSRQQRHRACRPGVRVETSYWSRSFQILCSDWLRSWHLPCAIKTQLKAFLYGIRVDSNMIIIIIVNLDQWEVSSLPEGRYTCWPPQGDLSGHIPLWPTPSPQCARNTKQSVTSLDTTEHCCTVWSPRRWGSPAPQLWRSWSASCTRPEPPPSPCRPGRRDTGRHCRTPGLSPPQPPNFLQIFNIRYSIFNIFLPPWRVCRPPCWWPPRLSWPPPGSPGPPTCPRWRRRWRPADRVVQSRYFR